MLSRYLDDELTTTGSYELHGYHGVGKQSIAWDQDSRVFAVALGNGKICLFDTICSLLCSIEVKKKYLCGL